MKLRSKETGEIGYLELEKDDNEKYIGFRVYKNDFVYKRYGSLIDLSAEWEDYPPKEPLIKDEKIRKAIEYLFPKYALVHIEKRGGKRLFEFGGVRVEINAPNENAIKHGLTYTIPELCGEDEE